MADTRLLADVAHFMMHTMVAEKLSSNAREEYDKLVNRLKPYAHLTDPPVTPPPYIDMNGTLKSIKDCPSYYVSVDGNRTQPYETSEFYEEFPEQHPDAVPTPSECGSVFQISMSVSELSQMATKHGPLWRKEKRLFLEHFARYIVCVFGTNMYIFNGEQDMKPAHVIHLEGYEARAVTNASVKDVKKRNCSFEIVCPGKKTLQYTARTPKDMEQWVAAITSAGRKPESPVSTLRGTRARSRLLPSIPNTEAYDDVNVEQFENEESDEIYHDIFDITSQSVEKVPLPPRRFVPHIEPDDYFEHDTNVVYDDIGVYHNTSEKNNNQSISTNGEQISDVTDGEYNLQQMDTAEDEGIYDDIRIGEPRPVKPEKPPKPQLCQENQTTNRIQHLIKQMEQSLRNNRNFLFGPQPIKPPSVEASISNEELYEPIENGPSEVDAPQLPPRLNVVR